MERIQKIIANSGYCSRRKAEELIEQGKVKLNGVVAKLGDKADASDRISVNGREIIRSSEKFYYILNKPKGILVTKNDPKSRRTIYNLKSMSELKKKIGVDLNYVGRLDGMSEGLLILTNDGELNNLLTHPSHHIKKTYLIRTEPTISRRDIAKLENGLMIDGRELFAKISNVNKNSFEMEIKEGRNRIIRRAIEDELGYKIYQLKRVAVGELSLGDLESGEVREVCAGEVGELGD